MLRRPELLRPIEEAAAIRRLAALSVPEAFRIAQEMDDFSRRFAPEAFIPAAPRSLSRDAHVLMHRRLHEIFGRVRAPRR